MRPLFMAPPPPGTRDWRHAYAPCAARAVSGATPPSKERLLRLQRRLAGRERCWEESLAGKEPCWVRDAHLPPPPSYLPSPFSPSLPSTAVPVVAGPCPTPTMCVQPTCSGGSAAAEEMAGREGELQAQIASMANLTLA